MHLIEISISTYSLADRGSLLELLFSIRNSAHLDVEFSKVILTNCAKCAQLKNQ